MVNSISGTSYATSLYTDKQEQQKIIPRDLKVEGSSDLLILGKGEPVTQNQAMNVVLERAMDKLRSVVSDAKAALGISENAQLDTSPEATGTRIADFALGSFDKWRQQHTSLSDGDARKQFADFIGAAVQQGIGEARSILGSLSALNSDVNSNIDKTWSVVQDRLNKFVANEN